MLSHLIMKMALYQHHLSPTPGYLLAWTAALATAAAMAVDNQALERHRQPEPPATAAAAAAPQAD
jgi:hypothetical protein